MKKREMTTNELEQLFNSIIEQEPLINEEQTTLFLYNLPQSPIITTFKRFFQNHLNTFLVGTFMLTVVIALFVWINIGHKTEDKMAQNNQPFENKVTPTHTDTVEVISAVGVNKDLVPDTEPEDNTLEKTFTKIIQTDTIQSVSDIYKRFDKKPQLFSILADRDTTIFCKEGTSIKIKANTFISESTGNEISGKVQLAVKEYYKLSDIILSNLSTTSGEKMLETGGMLHLAATADNENCIIKQGGNIDIGFPYSDKKDDMKLFNGTWLNDKIYWELTNTATNLNIVVIEEIPREETEEPTFIIVDEPAEYPGGSKIFKKYIEENAQYPFSALKDKIEGTVYVQFAIDRYGYVSDIKVLRGLGNTLDNVAVYIVSKMPVWKPAKQIGRPVKQQFVWPIKFAIKDTVLTKEEILQAKLLDEKIKNIKVIDRGSNSLSNDKEFSEDFEKKAKDNYFEEATVSEVNRYLFSASQLGWINCDRFIKYSNIITDYSILIDKADKAIITVIFQKYKSILPGKVDSNRITFKNVPLGEKITIVAIKTFNNNIFLALKETTITDTEETLLDFQTVSLNLLKNEMEKLNK